MHHGASQALLVRVLAGGGLHERGPAQVDRAIVLHDDRLVAHGRGVRAARRAHAAHDRDLRYAESAHAGLVVELAAALDELGGQRSFVGQVPVLLPLGAALVALRVQLRAATVDQVDTRQVVLLRNLLRAQPLLVAHREVHSSLDCSVGPQEHALAAADDSDAADGATAVHTAAVHLPPGQRRQLQNLGALIDDGPDALSDVLLAALPVPLHVLLRAASGHDGETPLQLAAEGRVDLHPLPVGRVLLHLRPQHGGDVRLLLRRALRVPCARDAPARWPGGAALGAGQRRQRLLGRGVASGLQLNERDALAHLHVLLDQHLKHLGGPVRHDVVQHLHRGQHDHDVASGQHVTRAHLDLGYLAREGRLQREDRARAAACAGGLGSRQVELEVLNPRGVHPTTSNVWVRKDPVQELFVHLEAVDHKVLDGLAGAAQRLRVVGPAHDELGDHRVVRRDRLRAGGHRAVDAHASGLAVLGHPAAAAWQQAHPHLDGDPVDPQQLLSDAQVAERPSGGYTELQLYQVQPGHLLRDGVLHLDARVQLQKVEPGLWVRQLALDEEFHGASVQVAHGLAQAHGRRADPLAQPRGDALRGGDLHNLLLPQLH
mmetsp:Transcript_27834/g.79366  ORF Transcript_27834/g.79366 Transcript_27834/m.79366 type:complete len:602 (-) Transcript_27834:478-2283(-)